MVGDRYLTDVAYGNKNGMLTIRPAPLTMRGEPSVVRMVRPPSRGPFQTAFAARHLVHQSFWLQARAVEDKFVRRRLAKGAAVGGHCLLL